MLVRVHGASTCVRSAWPLQPRRLVAQVPVVMALPQAAALAIPLAIVIVGGVILVFALKKSPEIKIKVRFFFYRYVAALLLQYALRWLLL